MIKSDFHDDMEIVVPSLYERKVLEKLDPWYEPYTEMSLSQRAFLTSLILRNNPSYVLEIGTSDGGSSCVILNALEHLGGKGILVSIDLSERAYKNPDNLSGWCVEHYPNLNARRKIYTGKLAYAFMKEVREFIQAPIDFAIIDTLHVLPGEILDFLMVFPFLSEQGIIVFHDTSLHLEKGFSKALPTALLMSAIHGKKLLEEGFAMVYERNVFPNIAGVELNGKTDRYLFDIFNLLTLHWNYLLPEDIEEELENWFTKYYGTFWGKYFHAVCIRQHENFNYIDVIKGKVKDYFPIRVLQKIKRTYQKFV